MSDPIHPYARSENPYEFSYNLNSSSPNQTAIPNLRIIRENNEGKIYPSIQSKEVKNKKSINGFEADSSSIVGSTSSSDEEGSKEKNHTASEPRLISRSNPTQKKNINPTSQLRPISFFEHMPEDMIRKIFIEHLIELKDIPTAAKNLMAFAGVSKFNQEFVRKLLTEEGMHEVFFGITKPAIPNLLAKLAKDKKGKSTISKISDRLATFVNGKKENINQADIDSLVHERSYLTVDCSCQENTIFTNRGLDAVKKIVSQPGLRVIRIINNLPEEYQNPSENFRICNDNGLELLHPILSRESSEPLTVDFIFNNWVPPFNSKFEFKEGSLDLIKNIQDRADKCKSVKFGQIDLSRSINAFFNADRSGLDLKTPQQNIYRFNFAKMMCHIGLSHSAHTISLAGFLLSDKQLASLINEIQQYDNSSLQQLDLGRNEIKKGAIEKLSNWLQSSTVCIKTLNLKGTHMRKDEIDIFYAALKNNHSLKLVEIDDNSIPLVHPIRNDERVNLLK
jgi:hypothetical protein